MTTEPTSELPTPPRKETEPSPTKALLIKNEFPHAIFDAIQAQYNKLSPGFYLAAGLLGEDIGFTRPDSSAHPLTEIRTKIHANLMFTQFEDIPDKPGHQKGVGERQKEFNIATIFNLPDHTFLDEAKTTRLVAVLKRFGYDSSIAPIENGNRALVIQTPEGSFDLLIGWENADSLAQYYRRNIEIDREKHPSLLKSSEAQLERVLKGNDKSQLSLEITNSHHGHGPSGVPMESKEQVINYLNRSQDLTEAVATALVETLSPNKRYSKLKMDWLPPQIINEMSMKTTSEVVGAVEPTVAVETRVDEGHGLERLAGLSPETLADLNRIKDRLQDPKRAEFMKKYGFKQSNGAIFWGVPGTGKTLAGEALAEDAGCQRIVLKVDEYMTAYMHESAHRLGEKLRTIKTESANKNRPVIVQIDEADTILRLALITGGTATSHDASEIRAVLLQEFQEPSNVFFILTTNLDPRDPRQADPAIVRNQRLGYLVAFGLPQVEGRQEIFEKEISKRSGDDLKWEGVDFAGLAISTEGFSPADIQEVLSVAVGEGYDPDTGTSFIDQKDLETAINLIKSRKIMEERIRQPLGFLTSQQ